MFVEMDEMKIFSEGDQQYFGFEIGQKIKMRTIEKQVGGGAANSAAGFAKMGFYTCCLGSIGDGDNGKFILHNLQEKNIFTKHIHIEKNAPSSVSIIVMNPNGDRTVFNEKSTYDPAFRIPKTKAIYCGHLSETESQIFPEIFSWKQKNPEKIFAWNPGKTQFEKGFSAFTDIFSVTDLLVINVEEAELFTGIEAKKIPTKTYDLPCIGFEENTSEEIFDLTLIAQNFLDAGVKNLIITDGRRGSQFFSHAEKFFLPIIDARPPVHTLGAGDAFSVGAVTLLLEGKSAKEMLWGGSANASSVVQFFGAQAGILNREALEKRLTSSII